MGLYDREYTREHVPGVRLTAPRSMTMQLVLFTFAVYAAQLASSTVTNALALHADWFRTPWRAYELLTYGFLHDPRNVGHILLNMLGLWMFGRELEDRLGRAEYLAFYLTAIIVSGIFWTISEASFGSRAMMFGASGGVTAMLVLFALFYPHRQILFLFVIPMPLWVAAAIAVAFDVKGAVDRSGNIACVAHLAGAVFGLYYYKMNWRITSLFSGWKKKISGGPRLQIHDPDPNDYDDDLTRRVDEILTKIQEQGQDSLTDGERTILERASRRYQQRRR